MAYEGQRKDYADSDHAPNSFRRNMEGIKGKLNDTNFWKTLGPQGPSNPTGLGKMDTDR